MNSISGSSPPDLWFFSNPDPDGLDDLPPSAGMPLAPPPSAEVAAALAALEAHPPVNPAFEAFAMNALGDPEPSPPPRAVLAERSFQRCCTAPCVQADSLSAAPPLRAGGQSFCCASLPETSAESREDPFDPLCGD